MKMTESKKQQALVKLEKTVQEHSLDKLVDLSPTRQALALSKGLVEVAAALDPLMDEFTPLADNPLGFRTDKQYGKPVVRKAMVEALLRGLPLTGNHFNVIQERCYLTKEGFQYLCRNHPGVTDLAYDVHEPDEIRPVANSKMVAAYMPFTASWKMNGIEQFLETKCYVRMYGGNDSFYDGLVGKATRRGLAKVYERMIGPVLAPMDADDLEPDTPQVKDITPPEAPEPDAGLEESKAKLEEMKTELLAAETSSDLEDCAAEIAALSESKALAPSHVRALRKAYKDAESRIVNGESE